MIPLRLDQSVHSPTDQPLRLLCLGAHADDIEIGCGGFVLDRIAQERPVHIDWCVLSASPERAAEARASAAAFLAGAASAEITIAGFRDGYFPAERVAVKDWFETLKARPRPDIVLTHTRDDRHQDHQLVWQLTWNTFRDHLVLEYEIPKYEGDLATPTLYVPLSEALIERKIELLLEHFATQRAKPWFDRDTFRGLARLRGLESASPTRFAEAFHARKLVLQ